MATVGDALKSSGGGTGRAVPRPITVPNDRSREDRIYRAVARGAGFLSFIILVLIGLFLFWHGYPALSKRGASYFTTSGYEYTGAHPKYGVLAQMFGTITIALIAIMVGVPVAIGCALFLTEYAPIRIRRGLDCARGPGRGHSQHHLRALGPSRVPASDRRGLRLDRAPFVVHPDLQGKQPALYGSFFIGGLVVGLMIVPIVASVSREVFSLAPPGEREGALALGATKSQMIRSVVLPFGRGGLIGASMLGLGRALGETIAVAVILGGSFVVSHQILEHGGTTVAAFIALEFGTGGKLGTADLLMVGFVLFVFTLIVNLVASAIVNRSRSGKGVEL